MIVGKPHRGTIDAPSYRDTRSCADQQVEESEVAGTHPAADEVELHPDQRCEQKHQVLDEKGSSSSPGRFHDPFAPFRADGANFAHLTGSPLAAAGDTQENGTTVWEQRPF